MKLQGILILLIMMAFLVYLILNKDVVLTEHLTPGPPTLLTLQTDTQDLDSRLTELKTEFDKMSAQAKQGADAAAQSKAQMAILKNS